MRGTWDDVNRRLTGALLALDLDDSLVIGERVPERKGLFGGVKRSTRPRRYAQVTAAQRALIGEVVGSTSFGGDWPMTPETEKALEQMGWEKPWSSEWHTYQRETPLMNAPRLALAVVKALRELGCEVADLDVTLTREEPDPGDY